MILYLTILMNTQERRCRQLLKAAKFGYVGVVKTLIDKKYIDVNSRDDVSNYIIMYVHRNNDVINILYAVKHSVCVGRTETEL